MTVNNTINIVFYCENLLDRKYTIIATIFFF